ncbi:MAG: cadherin-like domain-containing protein [Verrucomicrobia bacterium]|nr:cadherin-like domain-containing protein [Verrucomicrobiota bacterium]
MAVLPAFAAAPQLSVNDPVVLEGNSGTSLITFNITLSVPTTVPLQIPYFTSDGTATAGSNYLGTNGVLNIPPNVTSTNIDITVLGDLLPEPDETFTLTFLNAPNVALQKATGTATIVNDDIPVFISITDSFATEGSAGTTTPMEFTLTLSTNATSLITVAYSTADGPATKAGIDYVATNGVVLFDPGVTTQTITVNVIGNDVQDGDRFLLVNLTNAVNAVIGDDQAGGFIIDDDFLPALRINDAAIVEADTGTTNMIFTVTLSTSSGSPVTVDYATADDTAKAGSDYVTKRGTITFAPGTLTQTILIPVIGDLLSEPTETFFINLANPVNAVIVDNQAIGTITDNDSLPLLNISDVTVAEGDTGTTNAVFTVTLASTSGQDVTVKYATSDGTATAGSDYVAASGTVTIRAGTTSQTISVTVNGDRLNEPDETFFVNLSSPVGARIGDVQGAGTILNDDTSAYLTIDSVSKPEGNSGTNYFVFNVSLVGITQFFPTVDYYTVGSAVSGGAATGGTNAAPGVDFLLQQGTLVFGPTTTNRTIIVPVLGDLTFEPDKSFLVVLTNAHSAIISSTSGVGVGIIQNDDSNTLPTISINDVSLAEGNAGTVPANFTLSLSMPSAVPITVSYSTADGTATVADQDYQTAFGSVTFNPGETVKSLPVNIVGDTKVEGDETFTVKLSSAPGAIISRQTGTCTILNDDSPGTALVISINDAQLVEGDSGTNFMVFDVVLSAPSPGFIRVDYSTLDGTATTGSDYVAPPANSSVIFSPGSTHLPIRIGVIGDLLIEPDETFFLNLSGPTNFQGATVTLVRSQAQGTILNDDTLPVIFVSNPAPVPEGNSGNTTVPVVVSLSTPSAQPVTVAYATADGSATAGSDYAPASGLLTFAPGETSKTIMLLVVGDKLNEPDETFLLKFFTATNGVLFSSQVMVTIQNDDEPPANHFPVASNDVFAVQQPSALAIPVADLLRNDSDPDGDTLIVSAVSSASAQGGTVSLDGNTVYYAPKVDFAGSDSFAYTISDGKGGLAAGTVTVIVTAPNSAPEIILGIRAVPQITWNSVSNTFYNILRKDSLSSPQWTVIVPEFRATNSVSSFVDLDVDNPHLFYSVEALSPR